MSSKEGFQLFLVYFSEIATVLLLIRFLLFLKIGTKQKKIVISFIFLIVSILVLVFREVNPDPFNLGLQLTNYSFYGIKTLFWTSLAVLLSGLLHYFVWFGILSHEEDTLVNRYVIQFVDAIIYSVMILVIFNQVYHQSLTGLLVTSGVLAIVLGLSAQTTLGGVFSGLALNLNDTFRKGDYVITGDIRGEVVDMNWHSVKVKHRNQNYYIIPNKKIDDSIVQNCSMKNGFRLYEAEFCIQYEVYPDLIKDILVKTALNSEMVLQLPEPHVYIKNYSEQGIVYILCVYTQEKEDIYISDQIYSGAWYALRRANIYFTPSVKQYEVALHDDRKTNYISDIQLDLIRNLLEKSYIFSKFTNNELDNIITKGKRYAVGFPEKVIREGETGNSLFLIETGDFEVIKYTDNQKISIAKLSSGDIFGEMSFLTGQKRSATIATQSFGIVIEFSKQDLIHIFLEKKGVLDELAYLKAVRENELVAKSEIPKTQAEIESHAQKLKNLIHEFWRK